MIAPEVERLRSIGDFQSLLEYLREELDWPVAEDMAEEDMVYDYTPEEVGLDPASAVKIERIVRLRPLVSGQPWGIFYIDFKPGKLPVTVLRRILRALVVKKRAASGDRQAWELDDLLFISTLGESGSRGINLAHFSQDGNGAGRATLRVVDWDEEDTHFHFLRTADELHQLRWPDDPADAESWRETWSSAFALKLGEVAKTSKQLAVEMARLARLIRSRVNAAMAIESPKGPLRGMYKAFQEVLLHDLKEDDFADMYAQTITYGLFAARRSRPMGITAENARDMVPQTNPFLRDLLAEFTEVSGLTKSLDFDELGIDALVDMLNLANMEAVIADFGDKNPLEDPVIHFYELFLKEYDPKKKIKRGIFFTPRPVVSFIVRSVHELLRSEFGLEDGLADTTTWGEMLQRYPGLKLPDGATVDMPFVQILDPAVGTGTFLVEVIDVIFRTMMEKWQRQGHLPMLDFQQLWNEYVPRHLLPRLYGFEFMMAPYAIAHMKIGLKLEETGYSFASDERLRVYLTNTLEELKDLSGQFETMAPALAREAQAADEIKRHAPVSVVMGNPPYSNYGMLNRNPWILGLLEDYKQGLNEKKLNIDDDYVKFVRFGHWLVERTGRGTLAFITNHSYIDNPTFRRMRQSLKSTFTDIFVLDLHGNIKKKEKPPEGGTDKNVFDIQQGVAIALFVKEDSKEEPHPVRHADLWGSRDIKYERLLGTDVTSTTWTELAAQGPLYLWKPRDERLLDEYEKGWRVTDVFPVVGSGFNTDRDELCLDFGKSALAERMKVFFSGDYDDDFEEQYRLYPSSSYDVEKRRDECFYSEDMIRRCLYRPYDERWVYYVPGFTSRPVFHVMGNMVRGQNLGLVTARQSKEPFAVLATRQICTHKIVTVYDRSSLCPLWIYPEETPLDPGLGRQPNLSAEFLKAASARLGLGFVEDYGGDLEETFGPLDVFHYAYGLFHSPAYRTRYADLLKTNFPRLPLTSDKKLFAAVAQKGAELAALHLMESAKLDDHITELVGSGDFKVEEVSYSDETVWLDKAKTRGFQGVPEEVWNFHIGGYQVCEKWLKDRRGRVLSDEDIAHYQRIVVALNETIRLMGEIDEVIEAHGGWPLPGSVAGDPTP